MFEFPLPPLPEQRAIARALGAVQETVEARRRELALERERKAALMQHLFTHGTRGESRKQTEIGEMPESWKVVRLGDYADVRSGSTFPHSFQGNGRAEGRHMYLKVSDTNLPGNETAINTATNWIDDENAGLLGARPFPPGTVLFPRVGATIRTNKKRLTTMLTYFDDNILGVTILDDSPCAPLFLFYYYTARVDLSQLASPGALPVISATRVKNMLVPLPEIPEQYQIANAINSCDGKISALDREVEVAEELFRAMLEELMTGRLRATGLIEELVG